MFGYVLRADKIGCRTGEFDGKVFRIRPFPPKCLNCSANFRVDRATAKPLWVRLIAVSQDSGLSSYPFFDVPDLVRVTFACSPIRDAAFQRYEMNRYDESVCLLSRVHRHFGGRGVQRRARNRVQPCAERIDRDPAHKLMELRKQQSAESWSRGRDATCGS